MSDPITEPADPVPTGGVGLMEFKSGGKEPENQLIARARLGR
jgi:hypothetical protein